MLSEEVLSGTLASSQPSVVSAADKLECELAKNSDTSSACFAFLKVNGWKSGYNSVDLLLRHLSRKCKSEASRKAYLNRLYSFCIYANANPDELVTLPKRANEKLVQNYADQYDDGNHSVRTINNAIDLLKAFFKVNGFKGARELEVEGHYMPARYRKTPQYIPLKNEIFAMADSACSLRDRAIVLTLYSSGIRNSTLRALQIGDVIEELSRGLSNIRIRVYPEMKLRDPYACKGNVSYFSFICDEAADAIRLYLRERRQKYGEIQSHYPLFASDYNQIDRDQRNSKTMSARELQYVVKMCANRAGLARWQYVTPHCPRKAFETILHSELIEGGRLDPKIQEFFMGHILPGSEDVYFDQEVETLRAEYSKLNFGRAVIENKFKVLRIAVAKAFQGSGLDPDRVIQEYVQMRNQELNKD
jgi:site-specific recombinase XerD